MSPRLVYLVFCPIAAWLVLLARSGAAKEHELLVLRQTAPKPRLDCTDRAVFAALIRLLSTLLHVHRLPIPSTVLR